MIGIKIKPISGMVMNTNSEKEELLLDREVRIKEKGVFTKRFEDLNESEKIEYCLNELDKRLPIEGETVLRIAPVVNILQRQMKAYDKSESLFKPFYKNPQDNPIRALFLIGSCAALKVGYLRLRDRLKNNPHSVTGREYDTALKTPQFYDDMDFFLVYKNPFSKWKKTLRSELLEILSKFKGIRDLHEDSMISESEMVYKIEVYKNILEKYPPEERQFSRNGGVPLPKEILAARPKTPIEIKLDRELGEHPCDIFCSQRAVLLYQNHKLDETIKSEFDRLLAEGSLRNYETHEKETLIPYRDTFLRLYPNNNTKKMMQEIQAEFDETIKTYF